MKSVLIAAAAVFLFATAGQGREGVPPGDRELAISLGSSLGDFQSAFTWGLSLNIPLSGALRAEPEFFYYFNPSQRSHTPGLAITSTGLNLGLSYLLRIPLGSPRILLDAGISLGVMHVSETFEYDQTHKITSRPSSETYVGPAAVFQFRVDGRSAVRFDARYFYVAWDGRRIPRLSIGYALWY